MQEEGAEPDRANPKPQVKQSELAGPLHVVQEESQDSQLP